MGSPKKRIGEKTWMVNAKKRHDALYYAVYWFEYQFQLDDGVNKKLFFGKDAYSKA